MFGVEDLGRLRLVRAGRRRRGRPPSSPSGRRAAGPTRSRSCWPARPSAPCSRAVTQAIVVRDSDTLDAYRFWVVGSVAGRELSVFWQVLPFLLVGLLLAAASTPGLNLLQLGDDVAALARPAPVAAEGDRASPR